MAIVMLMQWKNVTPVQYDAAREAVGWEREPAEGGMMHIVAFDDQGLRVTDIWESAESFQRFVNTRLMPGIAHLGLPGQPDVTILPLHAIWSPDLAAPLSALRT